MKNLLVPVSPDAKILRKHCAPISKKELRAGKTQDTIERMLDFVYGTNNKGQDRDRTHSMTVGLSANQVGIGQCISIVDMAIGRKYMSDIQVLINPTIVWQSKTQTSRVEGCVNLQYIWGEVNRSQKIKVHAWDRSGNEMLLTLTGWPAVLLQHEIDHLQGILFIDRLTDPTKALHVQKDDYAEYKRDKKKWKKYIDVSRYVVKM